MAATTVARPSACEQLALLLESEPVARLIEDLEATRWTGRPGYPVRTLMGACLVKTLYALPTWTRTVRLIAEHDGLTRVLGERPSIDACYRFTRKLRRHGHLLDQCIDSTVRAVRERYPEFGTDIAIDGSDLPGYANGMRFLSKGGPERRRFSDPDASWGHRSAVSTRSRGGYYGFKLHAAVCTNTGLPIAWHVATARDGEALFVTDLIGQARARGCAVKTCAADKGYDFPSLHAKLEALDCAPVIPLRKTPDVKRGDHLLTYDGPPTRLHPRIPRSSARFSALYRARSAVEREFGRLKHNWGLLPLRVRGRSRVALHADLTMLTRLGCALVRS